MYICLLNFSQDKLYPIKHINLNYVLKKYGKEQEKLYIKRPDKPGRYPKHTKRKNEYLNLQNKNSFAMSPNHGRIKLEVCYDL